MARMEQIKMSQSERQNRYFSESFRKQKVRELEKGLTTVRQISRTYQVSETAVYKWRNKYSSILSKKERLIVEKKSDTKRIVQLEEKIRELERLVGQKQVAIEFYEKMLELGKQQYGIDFKKNYGSIASSGIGSTEESTDIK